MRQFNPMDEHAAPPRPACLFLVQEASRFCGQGHTVGVFADRELARAYALALGHEDTHDALHIVAVPWSGVDGGYVVGADRQSYRPPLHTRLSDREVVPVN